MEGVSCCSICGIHTFCAKSASVTLRSGFARNNTPVSMNNLLNDQILPALNACEQCGKLRAEHAGADHEYETDRSRPAWHGWHAFRRGLATNLHDLGVDDKTIQAILRHSNVAVTQACYIKTLRKQSIAAMQKLEMVVDRSSQSAMNLQTRLPPIYW